MAGKIPAARALVQMLAAEDVRAVFGIPGGPVLPLYDELFRQSGIRTILVKHEQAAAYAAFAYARITGKLGVCISTLGPGATNLLSGLPVALVTGTPVLALTGQVQTTAFARAAHQESTGWFHTPNQEAMFSGTCKHTATCTDATRFCSFVRHSIRIATSGRPGPAHLIFPANLLHQEVQYAAPAPDEYRIVENRACDDSAIQAIAARVSQARYPLLLAGERAWLPDAGLAIQALSESHRIPVITDLACKSVVEEDSPLYLGCIGVLGHRAGERYLKEKCDLLLTVGQTFDEISTLSWDPVFAEKCLIQLDSDAEEIGKVYPVAAAAAGHLPTVLQRLNQSLRSVRNTSTQGLREGEAEAARLKEQYPLFQSEEMRSGKVPLLPQRIIHDLQCVIPGDAIILSDSSKWARWLGRFFQSKRRMIVSAHDYEPMGWAVAGVIGAKVACPERPVICVSGDGAFLMSAMEVATAANYDLDIKWLVMNDSRLGIIYDLQQGLYGGRISATAYKNPDFVQFARAFGICGTLIDKPGQLACELRRSLEAKKAEVFDIRFDADEIPPVRPRSLLITKEMGLPNPVPSPETTRALLKLLKEK